MTDSTRRDVLAIGELNPDLILSGIAADAPVLGTEQTFSDELLTLGSSTAISCVLMQRLGASTSFAGVVGDDEHGRFCRRALEQEGVNTELLEISADEPTGITISISYASDRLLLTRLGTIGIQTAERFDTELLARYRHIHVGSWFLQSSLRPGLGDLFERARDVGCTTSLDFGWDPSGAWAEDGLVEVLPHVDTVFPNQDELHGLTGSENFDESLAALHALGAREIALKMGRNGGALSGNGNIVRHPGFPAKVVDTTGAGDAFNAGFITARLDGKSREEALAWATAAGSLAVEGQGGTCSPRNLDEVLTRLKTGIAS